MLGLPVKWNARLRGLGSATGAHSWRATVRVRGRAGGQESFPVQVFFGPRLAPQPGAEHSLRREMPASWQYSFFGRTCWC